MEPISHRSLPQGPLANWGRVATRHPWRVILATVTLIALLAITSSVFGGSYTAVFSIPNSETQDAIELLKERFPAAAGDSATLVFHAKDTAITDPAIQQEITAILDQASQLPGVVGVTGPGENPAQIAPDGTIAYATLQYAVAATEVGPGDVDALFDLVDAASTDQLQVEVGGQIVTAGEIPELGSSEIIGIIFAMVIMLVMFGSVIAMGLPIVTALIGVGVSLLAMPLFANLFTLHSMISSAFLSMIGLGVGIDYALFIVNRFRDNLIHGHDIEDSVSLAIDTSGRSVIFAGVTVAIGLLGLALIGIPFVTGLGVTGAVVVLISVAVAIFLMPAILGLVGTRILAWRIPGLGRSRTDKKGFWFRWGRAVQSRPGVISVMTSALLLLVATPYMDMELRLTDAGNNPESMYSRRAYDLLEAGFGPGMNGPLLLVFEADRSFTPDELGGLTEVLAEIESVAAVAPAVPNADGNTAIIQLIPRTGPQDPETEALIHHLRSEVLPTVTRDTGTTHYVAGATAANIDLSQKISDRMPIFYGVVIGLSVILLAVVFRSLVVPLKAALTTLLSVGATFGAVVAVFQWGWLQGLFGIEGTGPIETFMPMILFGVLFGLSMDYEVFLLSRVHEEHAHGVNAKIAMLDGVGYSGKVVAAAGAIMGAVFLSFILEDMRILQLMGFGLGIAVLIDAFVVRLILVPAVMTVLDERAWIFPDWLDRVVPNINVEGTDIDMDDDVGLDPSHQSPTSS